MDVTFIAGQRRHRIDAENGVVYNIHGKPIKSLKKAGYIHIRRHLGTTGIRGCVRAHRVIWESVHGPIPAGLQINHINGVKTDNRIANLELVTQQENNLHAYRLGLRSATGEHNGRAKLTVSDVRNIRSEQGMTRPEMAKRYGVSVRAIDNVRYGVTWRHIA